MKRNFFLTIDNDIKNVHLLSLMITFILALHISVNVSFTNIYLFS